MEPTIAIELAPIAPEPASVSTGVNAPVAWLMLKTATLLTFPAIVIAT